ncbi:MAG: hypothetical protein QOE90_1865 [Thermoplasmata archaeon]|jgi:hypothetical protein|nr:hypothetical protein [Thermoplasmata archaeon]
MRSVPIALLVAAAIALSGTGYAAYVIAHPRSVDTSSSPEEMDMDGMGDDEPMGGAYDWHGGTGTIPTLADSLTKLERRDNIVIQGDKAFNPANGVRGGHGTFEDPYVISGWSVDTVLIKDTSKAWVFEGNYVSGIFISDWTGQGGYVHHDHLENMRTNRNVARTGAASATVFENDEIMRVEQLRHFDGELRNNTIGQPDPILRLAQPDVILDIAGLNGAGIHDNQVFGGVDMKIHGHHHSDAPGLPSHNHGQGHLNDTDPGGVKEDHQVRYVDFEFYGNHLVDDKFGLRYNDLNHAGDDRQATSEQNPALDLPHVHHTTIRIHDNLIEGATLRVATVNAPDDHHLPGESAMLDVYNNTVAKPAAGDGIQIQDVRDATVMIHGNHVQKGLGQTSAQAAIGLLRFKNSTVIVRDNDLGAYTYGVQASQFDNRTHWSVEQNAAPGVLTPVFWDSSVQNPPDDGEGNNMTMEHGHGQDFGYPDLPPLPALR